MAGAMEKIKAKVENVLHKDKDTTHDTTHSGTHSGTTGTHTTGTHTGTSLPGSTHNDPTGPHSSHTANQADPRVDSDRYGTAGNTTGAGGVGAGQYGTTGTHGTTGSGLTGSHDTYGSNTHGTTGSGLTGSHGTTGSGLTGSHGTTHGSDPTGPHDSKLANKLDPRVDSDKVGPAGNSSSIGGYGNEHHTSGQQTYQTDGKKLPEALLEDHSRADHHSGAGLSHSSHTNTGSGLTGSNTHSSHTRGSDPTGPHDSHLANKADPRVDSDRYGAAGNTSGAGGYGAGQYGTTGSGLTGSHGTTGSGLTGSHGTHGSTGYGTTGSGLTGNQGTTGSGLTGTHGTHGSTGYGTTGSGLTGNQGYSDPTGPHDSHLGNKADPRVDSDRYGGQGNTYGTTQSSGLTGNNHPGHVGNPNANQTAGPHGSNILNKLDPRVDSDLDGSKRVGGDRTYG